MFLVIFHYHSSYKYILLLRFKDNLFNGRLGLIPCSWIDSNSLFNTHCSVGKKLYIFSSFVTKFIKFESTLFFYLLLVFWWLASTSQWNGGNSDGTGTLVLLDQIGWPSPSKSLPDYGLPLGWHFWESGSKRDCMMSNHQRPWHVNDGNDGAWTDLMTSKSAPDYDLALRWHIWHLVLYVQSSPQIPYSFMPARTPLERCGKSDG